MWTATWYDALNRPIQVAVDMDGNADPIGSGYAGYAGFEDADDIVTSKTYNAVGQVESETDANGHTTSIVYDLLLRPSIKTFADGTTEKYSYAGASGNTGSGAFTLRSGWQPNRVEDQEGNFTDTTYDRSDVLVCFT